MAPGENEFDIPAIKGLPLVYIYTHMHVVKGDVLWTVLFFGGVSFKKI